jgi:hypothetical protein
LKLNVKSLHFDTAEVIEAELQAVLNILTKHDFQGAYKMAEERERIIRAGGDYVEVDSGQ